MEITIRVTIEADYVTNTEWYDDVNPEALDEKSVIKMVETDIENDPGAFLNTSHDIKVIKAVCKNKQPDTKTEKEES